MAGSLSGAVGAPFVSRPVRRDRNEARVGSTATGTFPFVVFGVVRDVALELVRDVGFGGGCFFGVTREPLRLAGVTADEATQARPRRRARREIRSAP